MKRKPDFLDRPLDYTRTPRTSQMMREEYPTRSSSLGDRVVFYVALICFGFVAGYLAAGG